mgnify:CR=1 FL=1
MAKQDAWARPLANTLVSEFRVETVDYIRKLSAYSPGSGDVTTLEEVFSACGAITEQRCYEEGGVQGKREIYVWMYLGDINDVFPTTADAITYQGNYFKIVEVAPKFSGDVKYACKVRARSS